jgi:hypothetical protein
MWKSLAPFGPCVKTQPHRHRHKNIAYPLTHSGIYKHEQTSNPKFEGIVDTNTYFLYRQLRYNVLAKENTIVKELLLNSAVRKVDIFPVTPHVAH